MKFIDILNKVTLDKQIIKENDLILEFANVTPKVHKFGIEVRLHVMQPGVNDKIKHGPRVKVFVTKPGPDFSITLETNPRVVGNWRNIVSEKEKNILITNIKKYKSAFISFWNDPAMGTDELRELMDEIDKGGKL